MTARPRLVSDQPAPLQSRLADHARPVPRFALRPQEAADSVGLSLGTFLKWVEKGRMPKGVKVDGVVLYDTESVRKAWEALKDANGDDGVNPFD